MADPTPQTTALGRLAGFCYDRRRLVLVTWILIIIGVTALAQVVGTHFENKFTSGNTESQQASNILAASFHNRSGDTADVVFHSTAGPIVSDEPVIFRVADRLKSIAHVRNVTPPLR